MPVAKGGRLIRGNDAARFASKTIRVGGCLEWQGCLNANGYGKFMVGPARGQTTWAAHRWAYQQYYGRCPELLRHTCDNPRCVDVEHLIPGTQLENVHDAMERGRRPVRLTTDQVHQLRAVRTSGQSIRATALAMGVNYYTAYNAATGNTWKTSK